MLLQSLKSSCLPNVSQAFPAVVFPLKNTKVEPEHTFFALHVPLDLLGPKPPLQTQRRENQDTHLTALMFSLSLFLLLTVPWVQVR